MKEIKAPKKVQKILVVIRKYLENILHNCSLNEGELSYTDNVLVDLGIPLIFTDSISA